jgi:uncharacterized protein DUF5684
MGGLAQVTYETSGAGVAGIILYVAVVYAILVIPYWVIFKKAGQEGWPALIPIYSTYILLKIIGRPGWWLILFLIPIVNLVIYIIMMNDLSKSFGHGVGFTLGLLFLSIIFVYILAFGSSTYRGPAGAPGAAMSTPPPPPIPAG